MAKFAPFCSILSLIFLFSFYSEKYSGLAASQKTWCVAKPSAPDKAMQNGIDYACDHADCGPIKQGGSCFDPNTLVQHTSFAMNIYYQTFSRHKWNCDFTNSAVISLTDPSFGSCPYAGGDAEVDTSKTWCVAKPATSNQVLQSNLDFSCSKADCNPIKSGGSCYNPNTLINHASFAMNLYYQNNGKNPASCDFNKSALVVVNDPSSGGCVYSSS